MTEKEKFEIKEYRKDGRLAKYEKEFLILLETNDKKGFMAFLERVFLECKEYLKENLNVSFPELDLNILDHKDYTELCDKLDSLCFIPRTKAFIYRLGSPVLHICIDLQSHLIDSPSTSIATFCASYIEELIHSADPQKSETEISETLCSAIEGFLEIKL